MKKLYDFTLGCDPEFIFVDNGIMVPACDLIRDAYQGKKGLFGYDGSGGGPAEIRPVPATDPIMLVKNIKYCLQLGLNTIPRTGNYDWVAGSAPRNVSLGGHIHIGLLGVPDSRKVRKSLTNFLDRIVAVPALMIENKAEAYFRRSTSYGKPSDCRYDDVPWGYEYRTLSSWLVSPEIATCILALSYITIWEFINGSIDKNLILPIDTARFVNIDEAYLRGLIPAIREDISRFQLYPEYKEYIDDIFDVLIANDRTWYDDRGDMKVTWGLSKPSMQEIKDKEADNVVASLFDDGVFLNDIPDQFAIIPSIEEEE